MFVFLAIAQFDAITNSKLKIYIVLIISVIVMMFIFSWFMPTYVAILLSAIIASTLGW